MKTALVQKLKNQTIEKHEMIKSDAVPMDLGFYSDIKKGCVDMTQMGMVYVLCGIIYFIYSIIWKDTVTFFSKEYSKSSDMTVLNWSKFLGLQLRISILNAAYLILYGIALSVFNLSYVFFVAGALPFHMLNLLMIMRGKTREYVDYKIGETYK